MLIGNLVLWVQDWEGICRVPPAGAVLQRDTLCGFIATQPPAGSPLPMHADSTRCSRSAAAGNLAGIVAEMYASVHSGRGGGGTARYHRISLTLGETVARYSRGSSTGALVAVAGEEGQDGGGGSGGGGAEGQDRDDEFARALLVSWGRSRARHAGLWMCHAAKDKDTLSSILLTDAALETGRWLQLQALRESLNAQRTPPTAPRIEASCGDVFMSTAEPQMCTADLHMCSTSEPQLQMMTVPLTARAGHLMGTDGVAGVAGRIAVPDATGLASEAGRGPAPRVAAVVSCLDAGAGADPGDGVGYGKKSRGTSRGHSGPLPRGFSRFGNAGLASGGNSRGPSSTRERQLQGEVDPAWLGLGVYRGPLRSGCGTMAPHPGLCIGHSNVAD